MKLLTVIFDIAITVIAVASIAVTVLCLTGLVAGVAARILVLGFDLGYRLLQ